jgi:hypothetical protein
MTGLGEARIDGGMNSARRAFPPANESSIQKSVLIRAHPW